MAKIAISAGSKGAKRLSKSVLDAMPLPCAGKRTMVWDPELKGFGVRISANGVKTYLLRYRMGGRDTPIRTITIGHHGSPWTLEQARKRAAELLTQVRSGRDLVAERHFEQERAPADADTREKRLFSVMADVWFKKHVERNSLRSHVDIRGVVDRDLKPLLGYRAIDEISKRDVTEALDKIGERSGAAANKAHKWLRQIFNWLIGRGEIAHSPLEGISRPFPEESRTRVLTLGEVVVLWVALDNISEPFRSFYRFAILLGQRLRENANAPWTEFDLEVGDWLIPKARTKADRDHLVPMNEQAIELLEDLRPDGAIRAGPVFTTNGKVGISGFSKLKEQVDAEIDGLLSQSKDARALVPNGFSSWVVHDLRRTLATGCQGLGIDMVHTEAVLNHALGRKLSGVARVYHLYDYYNEKAEALSKWGDLIEKAVSFFRAGDIESTLAMDPARRSRQRTFRRLKRSRRNIG